jgi:hypothetical protein
MTKRLDSALNNPTSAAATGPSSAIYAAPRLTGKRSLEIVTLDSTSPNGPQTGGSNSPGHGWIGHP